MSMEEKINEDLLAAMKAKDSVRVSCLRMLKASMKNLRVEKGRELDDEEVLAVVSSLVRKGKEAAEEFRKGDREDLALKEDQELEIFYDFLPQQLAQEEIETNLKEIIRECSAQGLKDMGNVMKEAMARMAGKVQGKEVNAIARRLLSQ